MAGLRPLIINLDDVQIEEVEWMWPNRIPLGKLTIIAGEPGVGKSFLTLYLASRVSTGRRWPDVEQQAPRGSVVILSCEDDLGDTVKPRLQAAQADLRMINAIAGAVNGNGQRRWFNLKHHLVLLEQTLVDDTRLLIIDPISAFVGGGGLSSNTRTRALFDPIADLAARHNIAIVAVTHLNKNGTASSLHRIIDSIGQVAAARSAWLVTKDNRDPERKLLLPVKTNLSVKADGLSFRIIDGIVEFEPESIDPDGCSQFIPPRPSRPAPRLEDAIEWLEGVLENGPVRAREIQIRADEENISEDTLRRAKDRLGVSVYKVGNRENGCWYWTLPEEELEGN